MQKPLNIFVSLVALFTLAFTSVSAASAAGAPLPIDYWALRDTVSSVSVSPNGKHVLILKNECKQCENILEIYDTSDFSKPKKRLNADPMEFISAQWVSDKYIFGTAWKVVRKRVKGPEEDVRSYKIYAYNLESNKFSEASGSFSIASVLPKEPNKVLISSGTAVGDGLGVDPFAAFRPRSYYKYDLEKGTKTLVLKGNDKHPQSTFDLDGNPRYTQGVDIDTKKLIQYFRAPGDTDWKEFGERMDMEDTDNLYRILSGIHGFIGMKQGDPNTGYMIDNRGSDKAALYEFDFRTGQFGKKLFEDKDSDVKAVLWNSNSWAGNNAIAAAIYSGAKHERHWFDMQEKALYQQFEQKIPNAHQVSITSRSRDGNTMIVYNRGPKDPGSYWLVQNGKMAKLASKNPLVKPEDLADVEYIRYTARDGMVIPGYVTKPKGPGPHPLIVLPHGGPHVNEVIGYDEWGQFLANNGYMVLQPQYRMSTGWGQKHFDTAMGQHGLHMQDDKDDGAMYLVQKGWADPDRIAMFGWSYGGYAALVAASREPNLYQCVIAGAAVADAKKVYLKRKGYKLYDALDDWSRARGGFVGINPIEEMEKVNIPVMMVHGDWDARVLYFNFKDYRKEMERVAKTREVGNCSGGTSDGQCTTTMYRVSATKGDKFVQMAGQSGQVTVDGSSGGRTPYVAKSRFVTLKGADHFYATLMYDHQKKFYTEMLDFLKNDCGPGGL